MITPTRCPRVFSNYADTDTRISQISSFFKKKSFWSSKKMGRKYISLWGQWRLFWIYIFTAGAERRRRWVYKSPEPKPPPNMSKLLCTLMARQTYCTSICGSGKYGVRVAQWLAHPICGAWRRVTILNPVSLINILNSMKSPLAENTKVWVTLLVCPSHPL